MIDVEQLVLKTAVASRKALLRWAKTANESVESTIKMEESLNKIVEMSDEVCGENDRLREQNKNLKRFLELSNVNIHQWCDNQFALQMAFKAFRTAEAARIDSDNFKEMTDMAKLLDSYWKTDD